MAAIWGGVIAGAAGLLGSGIGAGASKSAAHEQAAAAQQAAQMQFMMFQQTAQRLQPWVDTGTAASKQLGGLLGLEGYQASGAGGLGTGALVQPFNPTTEQLQQTPGYQFTLQQGLQAVQNQATGSGQGAGITPAGTVSPSGPEGKGLAGYATGLASTTYQQQFNNYWNQLNNIYNMLQGVSTSGANAAAMTGQAGTTTTSNVGNLLQSGAAASAAGTVGAANQFTGALGNIGNIAQGIPMQMALQKALSNPLTQGTTAATPAPSQFASQDIGFGAGNLFPVAG